MSMGAHGARQLRQILGHVQTIVSIELLCAAQALDFQQLRAGRGVQAAYERIRALVPTLEADRYYRPDLLRLREEVVSGELLRRARSCWGTDAAPNKYPERGADDPDTTSRH